MRLLRKLYRRIRPDRRPFILGYHRVKDLAIDPWGMAVSPRNFERQIQALIGRIGGRLNRSIFRNDTPKAYITFDDGYSDNYEYAFPILEKYQAEATIFLATGFLGCGREYWWDRLERIFLLPGRLREVIDFQVLGDHYRFPLKSAAIYSKEDFERHRSWRPSTPPPTLRHAIFASLWSVLSHAEREYQDAMIASLEHWAECGSGPRPHYAPMTTEQVREMSDYGIHFGAHTVNHVSLDRCPKETFMREITDSTRQVTEITGQPTSLFSFPHGKTNPGLHSLLNDLNINIACTSRRNRLTKDTDPLLAPRIFIGNSNPILT